MDFEKVGKDSESIKALIKERLKELTLLMYARSKNIKAENVALSEYEKFKPTSEDLNSLANSWSERISSISKLKKRFYSNKRLLKMISSVNGFTYQNIRYEPARAEEKNIQAQAEQQPDKNKINDDGNNAVANSALQRIFGNYMSGIAADGRITIWGKATGLDSSISKDEANSLLRFIQESKTGDFMPMISYNISDELLNSADLSISEFKERWLQDRARMAEKLEKSNEDFFAQVDAMNEEAQKILNNKNNEPDLNDIKEESFKPIQGHSKNTETYDITKDEKFSYLLKLQELERERGIDVLEFTQKLEKQNKMRVDISV